MLLINVGAMFARFRRELGLEFDVGATRLVPVQMKVDRRPFDEAWEWCEGNCTARWRYDPAPSRGGVIFAFELEADAVLFALTFSDSRP